MESLYKFIGVSGFIFAAVTYRWMPWWGTSASVALGGLGMYLAKDERRGAGDGSLEWDWGALDLFDWFSSDSSDSSGSSDYSDSSDSGDSGDSGGSDD